MKDQHIKVTIGERMDMANEFIKAWHQAEAGHAPNKVEEKLYFKDERALFKVLTPKRCELLRHVHEMGSTSILALAKQLQRDYRNVHQDIKELSQIGLILKDETTGKYSVPWDTIVTEIPLTFHPTTDEPSQAKYF